MRAKLLILASALLLGLAGCTQTKAGAEASGPVIHVQTADPSKLEASALSIARQAAAENKRVLVYFHADWCGPCKRVGKAFERPSNKDTFSRWVLVPVNTDELPEGPTLGIEFETIPFFVKLDASGKAVGTLDGSAFGVEPSDEKVDEVFRNFLRS